MVRIDYGYGYGSIGSVRVHETIDDCARLLG